MLSLFPLLLGIATGVGHVVAGPDHLAAVAPLALRRTRRAWRTGMMWGLGHAGGVGLLAVLAWWLRPALPAELIAVWGERLVGVVLIVLGVYGLRACWKQREPARHVSEIVGHPAGAQRATAPPARPATVEYGALGIGALHGLAGMSHMLGVLPALLLPGAGAAANYVLGFGIGAVLAMTAFAWMIDAFTRRAERAGRRARSGILATSSLAALCVGVWWLLAGAAA